MSGWSPEAGAPGKVLLIQLRRLGDAVLLAPVLDALRGAWPGAKVHLLTEVPVPDLYAGDPRVDVVWVRPPRARLAGLAGTLRKERFDLVFDFQSLPITALLAWRSGAFTVGFRRRFRFYARSVRLGNHAGTHYTPDHKLDLLRALGVPAVLGPTRLHPPEPDPSLWRGLPEGPRVALVPVSPWAHKRWAPEAFAETATRLHEATGAVFVLAGGPGEEESLLAVDELLAGVPHRVHEFRRVREFLAFLGSAALFLGNDNGPRHMAMALGVPTLGWFGRINPTHWTPPGPGNPVLWDRETAGRRPVREDLEIVPPRPEAAAEAAGRLLAAGAGSTSR